VTFLNSKVSLTLFIAMILIFLTPICCLTNNIRSYEESNTFNSSGLVNSIKGLFENVETATGYRYNVTDDHGCRMDTLKIIEKPNGGYIGVYHSEIGGVFHVRLANSTDLLNWNFIKSVETQASQATIAKAPNDAYIVMFEKGESAGSHLKLHYYSNLSKLMNINSTPDFTIDIPRNPNNIHEGTPNIYNITVRDNVMYACIGYHYDNGTVDNVAIGWLKVPIDNPKNWTWRSTPQKDYNEKLRQYWNVKGNIGDRDYGQIFERSLTLQEANLLPREEEEINRTRYWSSWRIFLYDHLTCNFTMLNIKTHGGSTSFGNPTFTLLKSPNGKECIVVTYFIFSEGAAPNESGELIFYRELEWEGRGIWVWASSFSPDPNVGPMQIHEAFKNFSELNLNFVLFLVKGSDGWLYYNSSIGPVHPNYRWDPLKVAVEEAHRFGLELHAWFCVFRDIKLARERPDLAMVDVNGVVSSEWVCPMNQEVRKYMKSLMGEVALKYDIDGIHLDYIRFPNRTYCYCNTCRENWIYKHPEIPWPPDPTEPEWIKMRQKVITSFIEETRTMLKGINPKIRLSAAVYPIPEDAANNRMQNYPEWAEKGIVDFITPMTYTNDPCQFGDWLEKILKAVKGKTLIYPGIGLYLLPEAQNPQDALKEQINKTRHLNVTINCLTLKADGYTLFRYKYLDPFTETLKQLNVRQTFPPHIDCFQPEIGEPLQTPSEVEPHQEVIVTVNVTDYPNRVRNVTLWYKTDNGPIWMTTMKQICQNTYQATIPGHNSCTTIAYKIEAYDILGNKAVKDNSGLYYTYHVIPEIQSVTALILIIPTTLIIIKEKKAKHI